MLIDSPNIPQSFLITPYNVLDQKNISYLSRHDKNFFHLSMLKLLKNKCDIDSTLFNNLNLLDYFIILLQYRAIYIGDVIEFEHKCSNCDKDAKLFMTISEKLTEVDELFNKSHRTVLGDDLKITFDVPKISTLTDFVKSDPIDWLIFFVQNINDIDLTKMDFQQRKIIVESLPYQINNKLENLLLDFLSLEIPDYLKQKCTHCKHELKESLKFVAMFDVLQGFLYNFNHESCLIEIALLTKKLNLGNNLENISIMEKQKYIEFIQQQEEKTPDKNEPELNTQFSF